MMENSENPLVSVIVPCYNNGIYLPDALNSVLLQLYKNWECIILDDGSTDNTPEAATIFTAKDARFKYFRQPNKGLPGARNAAIKKSSGVYILPLDADDKIAPEYIAEAVEVFQTRSDTKLVYCQAMLFGTGSGLWHLPEYNYRKLLTDNCIFCSAMYRRKDFEDVHGYNEKMTRGYEDWEFWIKLLKENDKVVRLPEIRFYCRSKEVSMRTELLSMETQKSIRKFIYDEHKEEYDKNFPLPELLWEYSVIEKAYQEVIGSASFKIGRAILKPFWCIKRFFR
ncbi:MAG: glycosyltransferase family 2 protein [Bacteroidia bacterium]|nr:glycosyltransferase family 2 protein [Bacteroidia bacterium]